jgi:hypothetical protein
MPTDYLWQTRAMLAARFASSAILLYVRQGRKNPAQDGPVLVLSLRYVPAEAVSKMQASQTTGMNMFFDINKAFMAQRARFSSRAERLVEAAGEGRLRR